MSNDRPEDRPDWPERLGGLASADDPMQWFPADAAALIREAREAIRLRAEVERWRARVATHCREWTDASERGEHMDSYGDDLNAELWESLEGRTLQQDPDRRMIDTLLKERDRLRAEVERLRECLRVARELCARPPGVCVEWIDPEHERAPRD